MEVDVPSRLILFDGVCGFCDGAVNWVIDHDAEARFHFSPLQGDTAARLRSRHPQIPTELDTMVYVECDGGREVVYLHSEAVLRVAAQLDGAWRALGRLLVLPRSLTDFFYRIFVRNRYRVFGKLDACRVPTPGHRHRFRD